MEVFSAFVDIHQLTTVPERQNYTAAAVGVRHHQPRPEYSTHSSKLPNPFAMAMQYYSCFVMLIKRIATRVAAQRNIYTDNRNTQYLSRRA
jgi:hypothetical protein